MQGKQIMSPTNQLPENEPDHVTAPAGAELASVSPDRTFAGESEVEAAIAEQPKPPKNKKVTVAPWRAGTIDEIVAYPRWLTALRTSALVVQILGAFATGYAGARRLFESTDLSEMSYWDIVVAAWAGIRKLVGLAT
jgi:hypothetical protein